MNSYGLMVASLVLATCSWTASAQTCEGGVYLNPQVIRGEGTPQVAVAAAELAEFLGRAGLPVSPVVNVSNVEETIAAVKRPHPPCWVFGNPVVGLASGYAPVVVNAEKIAPAVLVIADMGTGQDPKPIDISKLNADEQARVLARLKGATCFGIHSGVTTELVKSEKLCGTVVEVAPQAGLGQNFLPAKAAFEWRPERWVGLITRVQGAHKASMGPQIGSDTNIHHARLLVVPAAHTSWGYGLYLRAGLPAELSSRAATLFESVKHPNESLARALDLDSHYRFMSPSASEVNTMRASLGTPP